MTLSDAKTWVDILSGVVTTLAILAGAVWFLMRRSLAGTLEITLTTKNMKKVNDTVHVVINVQVKNVGQTRIKKDFCALAVKALDVDAANVTPVSIATVHTGALDYSRGVRILTLPPGIEPNEELYEDVLLIAHESVVFAVGVKFVRAEGVKFLRARRWRWVRAQDVWESTALFRAAAASGDTSSANAGGRTQRRRRTLLDI